MNELNVIFNECSFYIACTIVVWIITLCCTIFRVYNPRYPTFCLVFIWCIATKITTILVIKVLMNLGHIF
jgi:hypothetical protein